MALRRTPQRSCIACRALRSQSELLRVVRLPGGELRLDPKRNAAGRGAYICPVAACVERAARGKILGHAFKEQPSPEVLNGLVEELVAHLRDLASAEAVSPERTLVSAPGGESTT